MLNIDLTPTFIDIAQRPIPAVMDGESILKLLSATQNGFVNIYVVPFAYFVKMCIRL